MFETIFLGFLAQAAFNSLDIETPFDKAWKNESKVVEVQKEKPTEFIISSNDKIEWVIETK